VKKIFLIFFALAFVFCLCWQMWGAGPYYVAQTAAGDGFGGSYANRASVATHNGGTGNFADLAGVTVKVCGTIYSTIIPPVSGSEGSVITYSPYDSSTLISTTSHGFNISNKDYITLDSLDFDDCGGSWVYLDNADHITAQYCTLKDSDAYTGFRVLGGSAYGQVLYCTFHHKPEYWSGTFNNSTNQWVGDSCSGDGQDRPVTNLCLTSAEKWRIEGNWFLDAAQSLPVILGGGATQDYLLFKGNYVRNRTAHALSFLANFSYVVCEGNYIWDTDTNTSGTCSDTEKSKDGFGLAAGGPYQIFRGNIIWDVAGYTYWPYLSTTQVQYVRTYHNTGYNSEEGGLRYYRYQSAGNQTLIDNIWKNNAFVNVRQSGDDSYTAISGGANGDYNYILWAYGWFNGQLGPPTSLKVINNLFTTSIENYVAPTVEEGGYHYTVAYPAIRWAWTTYDLSDGGLAALEAAVPSYVSGNIATSQTASTLFESTDDANRDTTFLRPGSSSDLINNATYLTLTNDPGGGSGTTMPVEDAKYFFPGWSIPGATADTIYVNNPGATADFSVTITDRDVTSTPNTLTLSESKTWEDDAEVYWCPDGECPADKIWDIGAFQYGEFPHNPRPVISDVSPGSTTLYADGGAGWNETSWSATISDDGSVASQLWDFGIEYLTDGTMETNPTVNWTANNSTLTKYNTDADYVHGDTYSLQITDEGATAGAYQAITTEIGAKYRVSGYVKTANIDGGMIICAGNATGGYELGYDRDIIVTQGEWVHLSFDFTATATTTYIFLGAWDTVEDGSQYAFFDDVTMRMISTDEDPGTMTYPDPGSYPTVYTVTLDAVDNEGEDAIQFTCTVTIEETTPSEEASDIELWINFDDGSLEGSTYTLHATYEKNDDDSTGTIDSGATINSDAGLEGTNGLDCPTAGDDFTIDVPSAITSSSEGRILIGFRWTTFHAACGIMRLYEDASNYLVLHMSDTETLTLRWVDDDSGGHNVVVEAANNTLDTQGTTYWIEVAWDYSTEYREVLVNGVQKIIDGDEAIGQIEFATLTIGEYTGCGEAVDQHIDLIIASTDSSRDLYALRDIHRYSAGEIGDIDGIDGTYGIDDSLQIWIDFVDADGNPVNVTLSDGANSTIESYATAETGDDDLKLKFSAADSASSRHYLETTSDAGYKIIAGMTSADLSITSITIGGDDSIDADVSIPAGHNLNDNAAIEIDTTSPTVASFTHCDYKTGTADSGSGTTLVDDALTQADDYWNDSAIIVVKGGVSYYGIVTDFVAATDTLTVTMYQSVTIDNTCTYRVFGAEIAAETTYVEGETCHLCVASDGDELYFNEGPVSNLKIGTDSTYPDKEEFEYFDGLRTHTLVFARVIQEGDRDLDLQAEGVAEDTGFIHGTTKVIDQSLNEIVYTLGAADPSGGNIILAAPFSTNALVFIDTADPSDWTGYPIDGDYFRQSEDCDDGTGFDWSAYAETTEYDGEGHQLTGNIKWNDGDGVGANRAHTKNIIYGSTVELGKNSINDTSVVPNGSTVKIPAGHTGVSVRHFTILGVLDVDETTDSGVGNGLRNSIIVDCDLANGKTLYPYYCIFQETEAAIEGDGGTVDDAAAATCTFEVANVANLVSAVDYRPLSTSLLGTGDAISTVYSDLYDRSMDDTIGASGHIEPKGRRAFLSGRW